MPCTINSKSCSNAGFWTKHLLNAEKNERVEIIGFYGLDAETIKDAFSEMRGMARASKNCTNYFSQYNINPRADEHLTDAQWEEAHALHRKNHGLDHLPYFRVRHVKRDELGNLRIHEHGIQLRVDPETGKAISDSLTAAINERTSRELEIRFGLERGHSVLTADREQPRPDRRPKKHESFRAERSKIDPETVKADVRAARQRADNGQSFRTALEESGLYLLARGDRRDFVIIDRASDDHSLARRLGMKTAELRAFMADLNPASLPSVTEAKAQQKARRAEREREQQAAQGKTHHHIDGGGSRKLKKMATEREDATDPKTIQRQIDDQQEQAARAENITERSERFLASLQRDSAEAEKLRQAELGAGQKAEPEDDIADARRRYLEAAEHFDIRRPYASLSEIAGIEGAAFQREQQRLEQQAGRETDPDKREMIDLRRQIEANDYMAITSHRLSEMSKVITGNSNSDEAQRQQERAEYFAAQALELRRERQELQEQINQRGGERSSPAPAPEQDNTPQSPREAVQEQYAAAVSSAPGQPATRATEPERPAEIILSGPTVPERETVAAAREVTDARQIESSTAEHAEITDAKAAKLAALAQHRAETEQSIASAHERGNEFSR